MNEWEEGFLVGLIEGEGWIGVSDKQRTPILDIVNTDEDLIQYARRLLEERGVHTELFNVTRTGWKAHWKKRYDLRVRGIENVRRLTPILSQLVSKHRRAQFAKWLDRIEESAQRKAELERRQGEILSAIRQGGTAKEIAARVGVKPRYIYRWLDRRSLSLTKIRSGAV